MDRLSIGAWNIRGLNTTLKHKEVTHFIHSFHLQLVGILERSVRVSNLASIINLFSHAWSLKHNAQFVNNMRISILLDPASVLVIVVHKSAQCVHLWVEGKDAQFRGFVTFIYASNHVGERRSVWDNLREL